jgi:exoribonuclease R
MQTLLTHPMQNALYFSTGDPNLNDPDWRHYALSVPYYTHFTSPIRRYADVVVHRLLDASLRQQQSPYDHKIVR